MIYDCPPAGVIYADPAWLFDDALPGAGRGASKHYQCLTVGELCTFPLPPMATDCVLALWRVGAMQRAAISVIGAWGFDEPAAEIVWAKTKSGHKPTSDLRIGMGRRVRNVHEVLLLSGRATAPNLLIADSVEQTHETLLLGSRGRNTTRVHNVPSILFAPRGRHSEKPEIFARTLQTLFPGPYVELFARRRRAGWHSYGNEL